MPNQGIESKIRKHAVASVVMVVGCGLVFGCVLAMNLFSSPPEKDKKEEATAFEVEKKPPPPKADKPKPQKAQRKSQSLARSAAPAPDIGSSLSGVSFGLPAFEADLTSGAMESALRDAAKDVVMTEDSVDQPAQPVARPPAEYPQSARKRGIEGYVQINLLVGTSGAVQQVKVLGADPPGVFEESAKACVQRWEFKPGTYQGGPVAMWVKQKITFKLN